VFAISIQNSGKKFSRRIRLANGRVRPVADKNAVGTCPRMIRTVRIRASGFQNLALVRLKMPTKPDSTRVVWMMRAILLIVLILLLLGALPAWPYSSGWGYYPSGGIGLILLIVIILAVAGAI
jgi:polyferredoxin